MQLPEIARLVALFDAVEAHYRGLEEWPGNARHHALRLAQLEPAFQTSLSKHPIADFVDLPEKLGYNLPTVIHALPAVAAYAAQMKRRMLAAAPPEQPPPDAPEATFDEHKRIAERNKQKFLEHVAEALDYTHSCSIDFREALEYAKKHLLPLQLKNMAEHLPERFEASPRL